MLPIEANGIIRSREHIWLLKHTENLTKNYLTFTGGVVNFNDYAAAGLNNAILWKSAYSSQRIENINSDITMIYNRRGVWRECQVSDYGRMSLLRLHSVDSRKA
jgi:hypothetical protein